MKHIQLDKGQHAIVDDEDFDYINRFKWCLTSEESGSVRAVRKFRVGRHTTSIAMERFIVDLEGVGDAIIHKNKNTLDNRKENLIAGYFGMKAHVAKKKKNCTSIYKGVYREKENKWRAVISDPKREGKAGRKQIKIGTFATEREAGIAYNKKAIEFYGPHAFQNDIV